MEVGKGRRVRLRDKKVGEESKGREGNGEEIRDECDKGRGKRI